ncbi:MAG: helicase-associated domain-containing protein [Jatrophihabitantaceae bacterium]
MPAPPDPASGDRPATLTDWLRGRADSQLGELLSHRPDLALPAPADLPTLASRLSVRTSVQRAVDALDAFTLRVLEALVLSAGVDGRAQLADAAPLLGHLDEPDLARAVDALLDLGLVWGTPPTVHLVTSVRESVGTHPAGLGRPAAVLFRGVADVQLAPVLRAMGLPPAGQPRAGASAADVLADPARVRAMIDACDGEEREVLDRLAAGPPIGTVRNAQLPPARDELPPPHRLLSRGLLIAVDAQTVELPREVAIALRPVPIGDLQPHAPEIRIERREPAELDRAGGTAVLETLRVVEALAESWTVHPPAQLRSGGVGVRDLRRTARELGVDEPAVALIAETAGAAGMLNATHELESSYLPTPDFDDWLRHDPAARWTEIASAWLAMTRQPSLVNQRGDRDRVISVLGPDVERGTVAGLRRQVLAVLSRLPPGAAPTERADVLRHLAWQAPRRASAQRPLVEAILAEADLLGLTAAGGLTGYTRTLLDGSRAVAEQVLDDALPDPVDHFLVQPDLTIVVPGPPTAELARELTLVADLESTGGASVYRITEATVRRALDAGRSGADLHAFVAERSRTPAPQALTYLIDDSSKRHGALRTGVAGAYLRCDDEALLTRVLTDREVGTLQLRRLAGTVAVSAAPVARMLDVLREAGYAPAAEAPDGEVIAIGPDAVRAPSRPSARPSRSRVATSTGQLAELVRRIRAGDTLTAISTRVRPLTQQIPGVTSAATMGVLRDAIRAGRQVLLNCAEPDGTATRHTIVPISMAGGYVRGHEPASQRLQSFPLHRLIAVTVIDDGGGGPDGFPDSDDAS